MTLRNLRDQIDALDDQILALLKARAEVVGEVAEAKRSVNQGEFHDPERERQVLERLQRKGAGDFPKHAIRAVFREVISACLSLEEPIRVAYLGPEATFSHAAARHVFGLAAHYREANSIEGVFEALEAGDATYGVVPLENSTEGAVTSTLDALIGDIDSEDGLRIRQEFVLGISLSLLSHATQLTSIERVYSHPQPLAQARRWLAVHLPAARVVVTSSTAAAVRDASSDVAGAAIASKLASEIYGVPILRDAVHDRAGNATRFAVIGRTDWKPTGSDKTTIAFALHDHHGALLSALVPFQEEGINLSRLESRPSQKKKWEYVFVADIAGHREDAPVQRALERLRENARRVKVLGSYRRYEGEPLES